MKEIKAFVRPNQADRVIDALENSPESPGVTVSDVRGYGHPKGGGPAQLTQRTKLEIVVPDVQVESVLDTIIEYAHTGRYGDGKIFVSNVTGAVRIRTGERDEAAVRFPDAE
ncbi:P-II family nitrogen regulator [Salisaeta longa]|uniref:P-II family nitrogen regulator n=1 Tax=Salisaeta longa TaxID=503170 RepID=UPI0003B7B5C8|nr:P-II family nitrogen regulator [Salisaeta longa]